MVDFGELDESGVKFYKTLLRSLLVDSSEESVTAMFARLAPLPTLKQFRTELMLFVRHFLGKSLRLLEGNGEVLASRIELAEQATKTHGHMF